MGDNVRDCRPSSFSLLLLRSIPTNQSVLIPLPTQGRIDRGNGVGRAPASHCRAAVSCRPCSTLMSQSCGPGVTIGTLGSAILVTGSHLQEAPKLAHHLHR